MKHLPEKLYAQEILDETEACELLLQFAEGALNDSQVSSLLSVYNMRSPSVAELKGFRKAMLLSCIVPQLDAANAVDIVGTGGDGKNTFNISTLSAIVVAAAGIQVVKHGNYAAGSVSGSSNVLEYLGYRFTADNSSLQKQLEQNKLCFLHAPFFHPAMKRAATARKELGIRTFFNLLGPVINPAQPGAQLLGVSRLSMVRLYQYLLENTVSKYHIVHALDGYDEISLTGKFKLVTRHTEQILTPADLGVEMVHAAALHAGNSVADAAKIFVDVLQCNAAIARQQVVIANSGFAIHCAHPEQTREACFDLAKDALLSGKAFRLFKKITQ